MNPDRRRLQVKGALVGVWLTLLAGCGHGPPVSLGSAGAVSSEMANEASLKRRLAVPDDAQVVILYSGERKGELGPCGCELSPRGSLGQVEAYAHRLPYSTQLKVDAGNWLSDALGDDGRVREDMAISNRAVLGVLSNWQALNVSFRDLPFLAEQEVFPVNAVSANLRHPSDVLPAYRVETVGSIRVGFTGVSSWGMAHRQPEGWTQEEPIAALQRVVPTIPADVIVVLAYETGRDTRRIAREVPGVDVIVEAGAFAEVWPPMQEQGVLWVRSVDGTRWLGELRLRVDGGLAAKDRKIEMDRTIPVDRDIRRLQLQVEKEREQVRGILFGTEGEK